jgi:double zinc ribbon protein
LSEKQTQQHRQHFNLSDETKQKLEELTARRYPGRQRRQSQLVEDLIMEAFEEEASTETETFSENLPLSAEAQECLLRASSIAKRMGFSLVQPNHLLWGILLIKRIRDALTASRPLTEILGDPTVIAGFTEDGQTRLNSCPFCGRSVQPRWKHCVYCGKSLARVCPKCGTPRAEAEGVRFCFECGSPLE